MLPEKIMQSDLLDILFEDRNKLYGAYALRKSYNKRLMSSVSVTVFIAVAFALFQFLYHPEQSLMMTEFIIPDGPTLTKISDAKPLPQIQKPQQAVTHFKQINNAPPVIASDDVKTQMHTVDELETAIISNKDLDGKDGVDIIQPPAIATEGNGNSTAPIAETKVDESPLINAEFMPQYPGGLDALRKFMLRNLRQPDDLQEGEKIIIMASFVVNKSGAIERIKINNTGRADLNKEVERVINKMPLWKPGVQNGNAVAVYFNLPVTFMSGE